MATSAILLELLKKQTLYEYYTRMQIECSNKYNKYHKSLNDHVKVITTWEDAYDKAFYDGAKLNGNEIATGDESAAITYANYKARIKNIGVEYQFRDELEELDNLYDAMKTTFNTSMETAKADVDALKSEVQREATDLHTVGQS